MRIFSPDGCYNELELDTLGRGYVKSGLYITGTETIDTIINQQQVDITKRKSDLNKILKSIKERPNNFRSIGFDAYRFQVSVDHIKKLDLPGNTPAIDSILKIFIEKMPKEDSTCSFLIDFKQANF